VESPTKQETSSPETKTKRERASERSTGRDESCRRDERERVKKIDIVSEMGFKQRVRDRTHKEKQQSTGRDVLRRSRLADFASERFMSMSAELLLRERS